VSDSASILAEKDGLTREAGRVVEITPIAVCLQCMAVIKPAKVKFIEALGRGCKYYKHEHPLAIVRLRRSGRERSIEYVGQTIPDWLRFSIERMWYEWKAPPEEVAYKVRLLLEAHRLLHKIFRCYGASVSQLPLPTVKSVHEPDWLYDFALRFYFNIPRKCREKG
jgi:hypothetical protein